MYLYAERFGTQEKADQRYESLGNALKGNTRINCAVFNIGLGEELSTIEDYIIAIVADREVPFRVLQISEAGEPYKLPVDVWKALVEHHRQAGEAMTSVGWSRFDFKDESVEILRDGTVNSDLSVKEMYEAKLKESGEWGAF